MLRLENLVRNFGGLLTVHNMMNKGQIVFAGAPQTLQADEALKHKYLGV